MIILRIRPRISGVTRTETCMQFDSNDIKRNHEPIVDHSPTSTSWYSPESISIVLLVPIIMANHVHRIVLSLLAT